MIVVCEICWLSASCSDDGGRDDLSTSDIIKKNCGLLEEKCGVVLPFYGTLRECVDLVESVGCYDKSGMVKCNYRCTKNMSCDGHEKCYYDCVIEYCTPPN